MLIETRQEEIEAVVRLAQREMARASADVLNGFELRSDAKIVRHPGRYADDRVRVMWDTVWRVLGHTPDEAEGR